MSSFRFGYQVGACDAYELRANAVAAEAAGFDVIHTADHIGDGWSPLAPLLAMASVTERIRLCPLVLNNDFHHPVHLAQEAASIDHLTDGRVELGIGAGHSFTEYDAIGVAFDPPAVRKARMGEAVEILRRLLDGETVSFSGEHYQLRDVRTRPARQEHLPLLVGVNGRAALHHAAQHADTIGLTMLGRTLPDGQRHETRWETDRLDRTVTFIHEQTRDRPRPPELHVLVQAIVITDDREKAAARLVRDQWVPTIDDALATPFVALGTPDEIVQHLLACRSRWGISYFSVRDIQSFAPVIDLLRDQ
jgi:probable F420-dependent oxidoreductase